MSPEGVYVISVVAQLTGAHPQTLRSWERAGLLVPARSPGGQRRYSEADLRLLQHILVLSAEGIPTSGIRRILLLEAEIAALRAEIHRRGAAGESPPPAPPAAHPAARRSHPARSAAG